MKLTKLLVILVLVGVVSAWPAYRYLRLSETQPLPPAPRGGGIVIGVPDRTLRFAAYNLYHNYRGMDGTVAAVRTLEPAPDFLLFSEIDHEHVAPMAEKLDTPHRFYPLLGYSTGQPLWPDVAILSRHRLFDGRSLRTADGHAFGLWAYTVVDNRKFAIVCVHLWPTFGIDPRHVVETANMRNRQLEVIMQTWRAEGSPPLVIGGDFNQPAVGDNYALMTREFTDTLAGLGQTSATFGRKLLQVRIDYLLATPEWRARQGGVIHGNASDHRPIWVDLTAAKGAPATHPATRPTTKP